MAHTKKIMIIEGNLHSAEEMAKTLLESGYEVVGIARTGNDAISIVEKIQVDLILLDIMLKGPLDGITTASKILSLRYIPIIYLTSPVNEELISRTKEILPFGFLTKPVDSERLLFFISKALVLDANTRTSQERVVHYRAIYHEIMYPMIQEDRVLPLKEKKGGPLIYKTGWMAY
ncbi:MAG TPA: response regulator [Methanospirillum sp.]|nr:response regulator [Methanospirillum sp.]